MEILEELKGGKVYLDTNVFIYAVEAAAEHMAAVEALFGLIEDGAVSAVTGELTLAEVLAKPLRWAGTTSPKSMKQC
jgi:predicted nucleic acid-binding protein